MICGQHLSKTRPRLFGFDSAVGIATDALDRLHTTANSHRRIMVLEVMGHNAGWLALHAGLAGGADAILLPEIQSSKHILARYLRSRAEAGKPYSIVVVAEGAKFSDLTLPTEDSPSPISHILAKEICELSGLETRETVLAIAEQ